VSQLRTAHLREFWEPVCYNSPDCPVAHRTVRWHTGLSDVPAEQRLLQRQRSPATAFNALQCAQKSSTRQKAHRTVYRTCPVHHRTVRWPRRQKLQRSESNGLVTWQAHRTVSDAPCDSNLHQTASLVVGAINTPNHPPFIASKFSYFLHLTRAIHSIQDTPKRSNPLQVQRSFPIK
jgi:hypothetical protein